MTLQISQVPLNLRTPGRYFNVDPSRAGTATLPQRTLLIGRKASGEGSASTNAAVQVISTGNAQELFGDGSPLHAMAEKFFDNAPAAELWAIPIELSGSARASAFDIGSEGTITSITLTVNGVDYALDSSDATEIAAEINKIPSLPFTAAESGGIVTLTARANGADEYYSVTMKNGDTAIAPSHTAGTGAVTPILTGLGDMAIDFYIAEQANAAYLNAIKTFIDDRWEALSGLYGHAFAATTANNGNNAAGLTPTQALTAASGRNGEHETIIALNTLTPAHELAAAGGGVAVRELIADPARPLQTLEIKGARPPKQGDIWSQTERNSLLSGGIATLKVNPTGEITIERLITTYRTNSEGAADNAWYDIQTPLSLARVMRQQATMLYQQFSRAKLADNGTIIPPGSSTVTPNIIKSAICSLYKEQENEGLVEGSDAFAEAAIVERNETDRNRVDADLPINLQNQLRVIAIRVSFII